MLDILGQNRAVRRVGLVFPSLATFLLPDENLVGIGMINYGVGNDQIPLIVSVVARTHAVEFPVPEKQFEFTAVLYVGVSIQFDHKLLDEFDV